jgi:DNA-binding NarL/FixJ family response regulator
MAWSASNAGRRGGCSASYQDDERIFQAWCAGASGYLLKKTPPEKVDYDLTLHELRRLGLQVEGHHYQSAAVELGVSSCTINFHRQNIYGKLQVPFKSEAVAKLLRQRLVK